MNYVFDLSQGAPLRRLVELLAGAEPTLANLKLAMSTQLREHLPDVPQCVIDGMAEGHAKAFLLDSGLLDALAGALPNR